MWNLFCEDLLLLVSVVHSWLLLNAVGDEMAAVLTLLGVMCVSLVILLVWMIAQVWKRTDV